jgi:hypothetical protein
MDKPRAIAVFTRTIEEAELTRQCWQRVFVTFTGLVKVGSPEHAELLELNAAMHAGLDALVSDMRQPNLVFATTGTTSSGKSSLVNMLCGAGILPVTVRAMTAGVTTIRDSAQRFLKIERTADAPWECGTWSDLSDNEICGKLTATMDAYNSAREDCLAGKRHTLPACPRAEIDYPIAAIRHLQLLALPSGAGVRLLDLPGLQYMSDEGNLEVIRDRCREALCFVTYNASETNPELKHKLLREVADQVKELGGSPARMLFILNRVDVYRSDPLWPKSENEAVAEADHQIRRVLSESLPDHAEDVARLRIVKLSAGPAMLALQMQGPNLAEAQTAADKLDSFFHYLVKSCASQIDDFDDLPRKPSKWDANQLRKVGEAVWRAAYGEDFLRELEEHIHENLPELVIPQALYRFRSLAGWKALEFSSQTSRAMLNSSEELYQGEVEKIALIRTDLERFITSAYEQLCRPFLECSKKTPNVKDPTEDLEGAVLSLLAEEVYRPLRPQLEVLYKWFVTIGQDVRAALTEIGDGLEQNNISFQTGVLQGLPSDELSSLRRTCNTLTLHGYKGENASKGWLFEAREQRDKENIYLIENAFSDLSENLRRVLSGVAQRAIRREQRRIQESLAALQGHHLDYVWSELRRMAGDDADLIPEFPPAHFTAVHRDFSIEFRFETNISIETGIYSVKVPRAPQGFWERLKAKFGEKYTRKESRESLTAEFPPLSSLKEIYFEQARQAHTQLPQYFTAWLLEQIKGVQAEVERVQNETLDRYHDRLEKAHKTVEGDYQEALRRWLPAKSRAEELRRTLQAIGAGLTPDSLISNTWLKSGPHGTRRAEFYHDGRFIVHEEPMEEWASGQWFFDGPFLMLKYTNGSQVSHIARSSRLFHEENQPGFRYSRV